MLSLGKKTPWLLKPIVWQIGRMVRRNPQRFLEKMASALPEADREVLSRPAVGTSLLESVREMFRSGNRGPYWDGVAFLGPWGFRAEDIQMKVHLWQGDADRNVPMQMGEHYQSAIPDCAVTFYPGKGHFIFYSHAEDIFRTLISSANSCGEV